MAIFGGPRRPKLDGLTKDEEKRRDSLNDEVMRRAGEKGVAGQAPAALAVLREQADAEPNEFLWACLLGWQLMSMRRYAPAARAFVEAQSRDPDDIRGLYGAGMAYFRAGESKQDRGDATSADLAPEDMTVDNLYQESLRHFRRAQDMTADRDERDALSLAVSTVERAVAQKAGRL